MRAFVPCVERPPYSRLPCDLPLLPFRARSSKRAVTCNNCNRLQTSELILSFRCGAAWCRIFFVLGFGLFLEIVFLQRSV